MMRGNLAFIVALALSFGTAGSLRAQTPEAYRVGGAIRAPQKIKNVAPFYPDAARAAGVEGVVIAELTLDTAGAVESARVIRSIPMLDGAALDAVKQWTYTPTLVNGVPAKIIYTVTVNFNLVAAAQAASAATTPDAPATTPDSPVASAAAAVSSANEPAPVRVGGVIKAPTKVLDVAPVYPYAAQQARAEGVVILELTLDTFGAVREARVIRSVPLLDEAAVDAVRQWMYTPTYLNGVATPIIYTVTVNFSLKQ